MEDCLVGKCLVSFQLITFQRNDLSKCLFQLNVRHCPWSHESRSINLYGLTYWTENWRFYSLHIIAYTVSLFELPIVLFQGAWESLLNAFWWHFFASHLAVGTLNENRLNKHEQTGCDQIILSRIGSFFLLARRQFT